MSDYKVLDFVQAKERNVINVLQNFFRLTVSQPYISFTVMNFSSPLLPCNFFPQSSYKLSFCTDTGNQKWHWLLAFDCSEIKGFEIAACKWPKCRQNCTDGRQKHFWSAKWEIKWQVKIYWTDIVFPSFNMFLYLPDKALYINIFLQIFWNM